MLSSTLTLLIVVFWMGFWAVWACLIGSVMSILSVMRMWGCGSSLLLVLGSLGRVMEHSSGVAFYLPWCRYLAAQEGVEPQLYADNLKCVSRDPGLLVRAAGFTTGYVRLVGQDPALGKCVLMSTSKVVGKDTKHWVLSRGGKRWTVKLDVRALGGHQDTPSEVGLPVLLPGFGWLFVDWSLFLFFLWTSMVGFGWSGPCSSLVLSMALRPLLAASSLRKLRSSISMVVWSRRQPLANVGAVLGLLDGPQGVTLHFVWYGFGFACCGGTFAYRPLEVGRVYRLLGMVTEGCPGHVPIHLLASSAADVGFGRTRLCFPVSGASSSGSCFFSHLPRLHWDHRRWGHLDDIGSDDGAVQS